MTEVFAWSTGQDENIGDSLLRRPLLDHLRSIGPLRVFVGAATPGFKTGLGVQHDDHLFTSFPTWLFQAARTAVSGTRVTLVANAGEVPVSRKGALRVAAIRAVGLLPRVTLLWLGAGVPGARSILSKPYASLAKAARGAAFRDAESITLLGAGATMPDWAFSLGTPTREWQDASARTRLALVLRGDRTRPSDAWVEWVRGLADGLHLTPTLVVQVRRDTALARDLAAELAGEVVEFPESRSHAAQEELVRRIYREARLVVGDRLHGLIVGATEGAVPLGWVESSRGKIARHFSTVGLVWVGAGEGQRVQTYSPLGAADIARYSSELTASVESARLAIADAAALA
ncbi:hypothetical protein [Microbacterium paludicola]|uniref:hypothetical protein n=1 Tax=Microbacterium paludicola TaxID=300019 RepID=UPI0031D0D170